MTFRDLHGHPARFLILSPVVCAIVVAASGWFYYQRQRETIENAGLNQLSAIANFKAEQIANWRQERIGDGRVLAVSTLMSSAGRLLSEAKPRKADVAEITEVMGTLSQEFSYTDGMLVDLEGSVRLRLHQEHRTNDESRKPLYRELSQKAVTRDDVVLSDLSLTPPAGRPLMMLTVPVRDLGALILEIEPDNFLYPYLRSWPTPTRSAESLLIRHDGNTALAVSPLRDSPGGELVVRGSWSREIPDEDQLSKGWFRRDRDYRGVRILGVTKRVPGSPWYLSVKIDRTEAESPLRPLVWELATIGALIVIANVAGVGLVWRSHQLYELRERESWLQQFSRDLMRARDQERRKIARDLHDSTAQLLAALSMNLSRLRDRTLEPERKNAALSEACELADDCSEEIRTMTYLLHPPLLDEFGLAKALPSYAHGFTQRTGIPVEIKVQPHFGRISRELESTLFRIVQEGLANIHKHSGSRLAVILLEHQANEVRLVIQDRGKGLPQTLRKEVGHVHFGVGMMGMRERAEQLGGRLELDSNDAGLRLTVTLPEIQSDEENANSARR
jgi:signal transduction histidine kinase